MTIKEAQTAVDEWIKTYGVRYFSELTNMALLTEEVGELAASSPAPMVTNRSKNRTKTAIWPTKWLISFGCYCA